MHTFRKLPKSSPARTAMNISATRERPSVADEGSCCHMLFGKALQNLLTGGGAETPVDALQRRTNRRKVIPGEDSGNTVFDQFRDAACIAGNYSNAVGHREQNSRP